MGNVVSLLERPIYTYAQVDRLLELSKGTARRWLNGYRRRDDRYQPFLRPAPTGSQWVTWGEFVETRLFAGYRRIDEIPAQRLRKVIDVLRREFDEIYPLAYARPYLKADGREILRSAQEAAGLPDSFAVVVRTGQLTLAPWVNEFVKSAHFSEDASGHAISLGADPAFPDVRWDPELRGGEPVIDGRNVRVATIAGMVRGGESVEDVAGWYELTEAQVRQAVGFDSTHARIA